VTSMWLLIFAATVAGRCYVPSYDHRR